MMYEYETFLKKAQTAAEQGDLEQAIKHYTASLANSGENQGKVLWELAFFLFSLGNYAEALECFVKCHGLNYRSQEVVDIIMEAYYEPNTEEFKLNYERNVDLLSRYPYITKQEFPDFSSLRRRFIPFSDSEFVAYDLQSKEFTYRVDLNPNATYSDTFKPNDVVISVEEYNVARVGRLAEETEDSQLLLTMKMPLYMYYHSFDKFLHCLQLWDLRQLLKPERIVFLFGKPELDDWFANPKVFIPSYILHLSADPQLHRYFVQKLENNIDKMQTLEKSLNNYYRGITLKEIVDKVKSRKLKILFVTSRFTTALQFYIRDCALACEQLGIDNFVLIEEADIFRNTRLSWLEVLDSFRPDMVFIIDHFRYENEWLPANILFVSWIMDPLDNIMSKETPAKLTPREYVLNLFISNREFTQLGYPAEKLIDSVTPTNPAIYKHYPLTDREFTDYSTDICIVSNAGNPETGLQQMLKPYVEVKNYELIEMAFRGIYQEVYDQAYHESPFYTVQEFETLLRKWFKRYGVIAAEDSFSGLAQNFRNIVGYRIMRSVPIEWLHERGHLMKLWGKEWTDHHKLFSYAMGVAQNGEVLSKIINASKIVLGTNPGVTAHPRVFETILSNSFYLGVNIPEEHDWANLRKYFIENEEIVFFNGREDLYQKVDYYLAHEEERARIIAKGQKKIKEQFTYKAMMSRVLDEIGERLGKVKENEKDEC